MTASDSLPAPGRAQPGLPGVALLADVGQALAQLLPAALQSPRLQLEALQASLLLLLLSLESAEDVDNVVIGHSSDQCQSYCNKDKQLLLRICN